MPEFYHNIITEKSFQFLQTLRAQYRFVLIGGWAVFLYTRSLKSKDIDIIVEYGELGRLGETYEVRKNDRLKKYEIKTGEFDVDVYVAHYSELGIPAETIVRRAQDREGFLVPPLELLLLLKLHAWLERRGSAKGRKDELDILSLAFSPECDWKAYAELVKECKLETHDKEFHILLNQTHRVPELDFNEQQVAKMKKKILSKLP
ncbi:MAG: hypothetical protein AAB420_03355 [Patescibacteria group bacterium]